jgi:hypothetical protein
MLAPVPWKTGRLPVKMLEIRPFLRAGCPILASAMLKFGQELIFS